MEPIIRTIMSRGRALNASSIEKIVKNNMSAFEQAFTHKSIHDVHNYEHYEFIGDSIVNTCIVRYLYDTWPQLHNPDGIQVLTRMKITIICREFLARLSSDLGFEQIIQCDEYHRTNHMKSILEDVFEAFFGVLSVAVDRTILDGAGFGVCKHILYDIMRHHPMVMSYDTLVDGTTRLKELCDATKIKIDPLFDQDPDTNMFSCRLMFGSVVVGTGRSYKKKQAYAAAADAAIKTLRSRFGIYKDPPAIYSALMAAPAPAPAPIERTSEVIDTTITTGSWIRWTKASRNVPFKSNKKV